jgi:hypothetical protein
LVDDPDGGEPDDEPEDEMAHVLSPVWWRGSGAAVAYIYIEYATSACQQCAQTQGDDGERDSGADQSAARGDN